MFRPGFQLPLIKGPEQSERVIQPAPITRYEIEASEKWKAENKVPLEIVAETIIDAHVTDIMTFVHSQRQNANLSSIEVAKTHRELPAMRMSMATIQGTEILDLRLRPESFAGEFRSRELRIPIKVEDIVDAKTAFSYWPIPGSQSYGNPPENWIRNGSVVDFYDAAYAPADDVGGPPPTAAPDAATNSTSDITQFSWLDNGTGDLTPSNNGGYVEAQWLKDKVGGSGVYRNKLSGKQYWEAEIKTLPTARPEDYSRPTGNTVNYGNETEWPLGKNTDLTTYTYFPEGLDTFYNPVIGIMPGWVKELSYEGSTNFSLQILGLENKIDKPRAIFAVRTSNILGPTKVKAFIPGGIYVDVSVTSFEYPTLGRFFLASLNAVDDRVPGEPLPADVVFPVGSKVSRGGVVYQVLQNNGSYVRDAGGPINGAEINTHGTTDYTIGAWFGWYNHGITVDYLFQAIGAVGGPVYGITGGPYYPGVSDPALRPAIAGTTIVRVENSVLTYPDSDPALYGDLIFSEVVADVYHENVGVPWDAGEGRHCPVMKGRADNLTQYRKPADGPFPVELMEDAFPYENGFGTTIDTGVDLGSLKVGDRIMWLTDTETRKVWIGINNVWKGADGAAVTKDDIAEGKGYVTLLDVEPDQEPDYYPAASFRYGPTWVRLHLGHSCLYSPPQGFAYVSEGQDTELVVPQGDEPVA